MAKQAPSAAAGVRGTPPRRAKQLVRASPAAVASAPLALDTVPAAEIAAPRPPQPRGRRARRPELPPLLMEPYDGAKARALMEECARRRLKIWSTKNRESRTKAALTQLLREDDQRRAAQHASAQRHREDLEALERGAQEAAVVTPAKRAVSPDEGTSFLSPTAAVTPASAAAANATVLYPPRALLVPREERAPKEATYLPDKRSKSPKATPAVASSRVTASSAPSGKIVKATPAPAASTSAGKKMASPAANAATMKRSAAAAAGGEDAKKITAAHKSPRAVRVRRSCHFRLINVMLSPEFNARWGEMNDKIVDPDSAAEVNQFWLDVHVAFMSVNQLFDGLHFHDALFGSIDPSVILAHEATRLRVMWLETVAAYQRAVADAKKTSEEKDSTESFFESCAKRHDLLYLHMGLLLEPGLSEFVLNMAKSRPSGVQRSQRAPTPKPATIATQSDYHKNSGTVEKAPAKRAKGSPASASRKRPAPRAPRAVKDTPKPAAPTKQSASPSAPPLPPPPQASSQPSGETAATLIQNAAMTVSTEEPETQSYALVVSGEVRDSAFESFAPNALGDDGYGSSDYDGDLPPRSMTPRKRRRSGTSTDIVEFHSTQLVPHPTSHRVHSTALATRSAQQSSDAMGQLDEWDILENRIRKVNESLDRCHRALSGGDGHVSESHRMTLESDLRFYSAIKQRLQEQLLMVMQGF